MVVRHHKIDFASGALVFPGGKLAPGDSDSALAGYCDGVSGLATEQIAMRAGALREAFEECGLLLARESDSQALVGSDRCAQLGDRYRQKLDSGAIGIGDMLDRENLRLACDLLTPFAHWVTPPVMNKRFDTWFFIAEAPQGQLAAHDGREAVDSIWAAPAKILSRADAGELTMVPATRLNVEKLAASGATVAEVKKTTMASSIIRIEPNVEKRADGVWLTIPPEAGYSVSEFQLPAG